MSDVSCIFDKFENLVLGAMCQLVDANGSVARFAIRLITMIDDYN